MIGGPFTQTYLGQGVHVDETAALFLDFVLILQQVRSQSVSHVVSSATTRGHVCSSPKIFHDPGNKEHVVMLHDYFIPTFIPNCSYLEHCID